jgi:mRNA-degrading endonuclease RelE of RelBE toxin-antitoxin system
MQSNFKPPFKDFVKKQHKPTQLAIEDAVEDICDNPSIGKEKEGDLKGIWVYKFKHQKQQYLIAYLPPTKEEQEADGVQVELLVIDFYQVGSHENFYRDLKKYLKS